jgi:hypothetical protein
MKPMKNKKGNDLYAIIFGNDGHLLITLLVDFKLNAFMALSQLKILNFRPALVSISPKYYHIFD